MLLGWTHGSSPSAWAGEESRQQGEESGVVEKESVEIMASVRRGSPEKRWRRGAVDQEGCGGLGVILGGWIVEDGDGD